MTRNMGSLDRILRTAVAVVLLFLAFTAGWSALWTAIAVLVAIVLLGTAAMGYCPPYAIFGFKTCKREDA